MKKIIDLCVKNKIYCLILIISLALSLFYGLLQSKRVPTLEIEKNDYSEQEQIVSLQLSRGTEEEIYDLVVSPRIYTDEEANKKMEEALEVLGQTIKGENESLNHVTTDLDFSLDATKYPFELECVSGVYGLIDNEGRVKNEKENLLRWGYKDREKGVRIPIKIILTYDKLQKERTFEITLFEKEKTEKEEAFEKAISEIEKREKEALQKKSFFLPKNVGEVSIEKIEGNNLKPYHILFFGMVLAMFLYFRERELQKERERKRIESLRRSYPWFVNEIVLLLGAGMQFKNILYQLVRDYERQEKEGKKESSNQILIEEMEITCHSLEVGMSESQAYYQLGRRLKLPCYIKLLTLLEQNIKKGSKGITLILEQEEQNALEERKNLAKRYGEEAGTKLLGPMILLLIIIMLIIMFPAFMSFQ